MNTRLRCAIYTRKSTEEGLEQSFNSLDAQRESCEAYVLSQAGEGWECLTQLYDDGGWSGGNMDRPAITRLLEDIGKGQIDVVVVYKVDRLTRSLMDFARIVEVFDRHKVSFVSVTQAFNTTSSMGRLTLNVLLSFAQFERDVTGERIRDKIAASKARGIWMGGNIPLGYDLGDRLLVINSDEAATVQHLYQRYLELKSLPALAKNLAATGYATKRWQSRKGIVRGGIPFNCSGLSLILKNRLYLGEVVHRGKVHAGEHQAIVDEKLFEAVQAQLAANHHRHKTRKTRAASCALTGKIVDADGQPMRVSFSYGRGKRVYRYYISDCLLPNGKIGNSDNMSSVRLPATKIENCLENEISSVLQLERGLSTVFDSISKVIATKKELYVLLESSKLGFAQLPPEMLLARIREQLDPGARLEGEEILLKIDIPAGRTGRTITPAAHIVGSAADYAEGADLIRTAHRKLALLDASPLCLERHGSMRAPTDAWTRQRLGFGLLAPDVQKALLLGATAKPLDQTALLDLTIPLDWNA